MLYRDEVILLVMKSRDDCLQEKCRGRDVGPETCARVCKEVSWWTKGLMLKKRSDAVQIHFRAARRRSRSPKTALFISWPCNGKKEGRSARPVGDVCSINRSCKPIFRGMAAFTSDTHKKESWWTRKERKKERKNCVQCAKFKMYLKKKKKKSHKEYWLILRKILPFDKNTSADFVYCVWSISR